MSVLLERRGRTARQQTGIPRQRSHRTDRPTAQPVQKRARAERTGLIGLGVVLVVLLAFTAMVVLTALAGGDTFLG